MSKQGPARAILVVAGMTLFSALSGALVALAGGMAAAGVTSVVLLCAALVVPMSMLFYLFVALAFVVVGQVQYFGGVDKAFWVPYLFGLLLYLRLLLVSQAKSADRASTTPDAALGVAKFMFGLFLVTATASSLINGVLPLQWFVAGKEYFFLWSIFLAFALGVLSIRHVQQLIRWIPWFLALQIPVVLYQRFVVAAKRTGDSPWDAVVGLFGGDPMAGGASGTMAIFSLISIALFVEAWKAGQASAKRTALVCACAFAACALAEVKLVIVMLPVMLLLIFGAEIVRRPFAAALGLLLGGALTVGMLTLYQQQYASDRTQEGKSLMAYVETTLERNTDAYTIRSGFNDMGRVAALRFWWREQSLSEPVGALVGHGLGSSRIGSVVTGDLVRRYQIRIARSSLAMFLWETGILGTSALVLGLVASIAAARRLARRPALASMAWLLHGAALGLGLILLTLPYGPDFVEISQMQILAMLLLGVVVAAARHRDASPSLS